MLWCSTAFSGEPQIFWGVPLNGFSIGLSVSNSPYDLTKPVLVTLYVRNDAPAGQTLPIAAPYCFYSFVGIDNSGNPLPANRTGEGCDGSVAGLDLGPGGMRSETVDLRDYLHLTNNGTFVITAKRLIGWPNFAFSGNTTIEVVSTNAPDAVLSMQNRIANGNPAVVGTSAGIIQHTVPSPVPVHSPDSVKLAVASSSTPLTTTEPIAVRQFTTAQKLGSGIATALLALLLVIIFRANARGKTTK